jgi:hypothetical protein
VAGRAPRWRRLAAVDGLFDLGDPQAAKRPEIVYVAIALERLGPEDPFITLQLVGRRANTRFGPLAFAGFTGGERLWMNEGYARSEGVTLAEPPIANSGYNPPLAAGRNVVVLRVPLLPATPRAWEMTAIGALAKIRWA